MKHPLFLSSVLTVLMATSFSVQAKNGVSGNDPNKIDDNPSASDMINLNAADLASKQASKQTEDMTPEALESIKPAAPIVYTPEIYQPGATGNQLLDAWLGVKNGINASGISVKTETIQYIGGAQQAKVLTDTSVEGQFLNTLNPTAGYGALLTTGSANFSNTNTSSGFSNVTGTGNNYYVSAISNQNTYDANLLKFSFTVAPGVNAVSTQFLFASEEYPEWTGLFRDGFAFVVDGVNYAKFDATHFVTLSDAGTSTLANPILNTGSNQFFVDNRPDANGIQAAPFEYDGYTQLLTATGLLQDGLAVHTIEVAIADSNDSVWDSAVFLSQLRTFNDQNSKQLSAASFGLLVSAVPEPSSYSLLFAGLFLILRQVKRHHQRQV